MASKNYGKFQTAVLSAENAQVKMAYYYSLLSDEERKMANDFMKEHGIEKSLRSRLLSCGSLIKEGEKGLECIYPAKLTFGMLKELCGKNPDELKEFFAASGYISGIAEFRSKWDAFKNPITTEDATEDASDDIEAQAIPVPFFVELGRNGVTTLQCEITEEQYNKILAILG